MIQNKHLQKRVDQLAKRGNDHLAERWLRIYLKIQARFKWSQNRSLNDAIVCLRVEIETAKSLHPHVEAMNAPRVKHAQTAVSSLLLQLLKEL